jgi:hypothetical protein
VKKLITDLATIDPVLRADLELIGKEVMRGPDARKPIKWVMKCVALAAARRRAGDLDARVTPDDFVRTSVRVLATGFRSKLNEDQQSDRLMELHKATYRVVNRVLGSEALCNHIRDSEGPYALAQRIVRTLLSA